MRLWLALLSCTQGDLTSADPISRQRAIDALSPAQARDLVAQLEKWAMFSSGDGRTWVGVAALRALFRADSAEAQVALWERAERADGYFLFVLGQSDTRFACDVMAHLWMKDQGVETLRVALCSGEATDGRPCGASLPSKAALEAACSLR